MSVLKPICIWILPTVGYMQMSISEGCFQDNSYLRTMHRQESETYLITVIEIINIKLPQLIQKTSKYNLSML